MMRMLGQHSHQQPTSILQRPLFSLQVNPQHLYSSTTSVNFEVLNPVFATLLRVLALIYNGVLHEFPWSLSMLQEPLTDKVEHQ